MGWPSALPSNWVCTRAISESHPEESIEEIEQEIAESESSQQQTTNNS